MINFKVLATHGEEKQRILLAIINKLHSEGERFLSEFLSNIGNIRLMSIKIFVLRTSCQMKRKFASLN